MSTRRLVQQVLEDMILIVRENIGDETLLEDEHSFAKLPLAAPNQKPSSSPCGMTFNCPKCTKDNFYCSAKTANASFSNHVKKCLLKNGDADESNCK